MEFVYLWTKGGPDAQHLIDSLSEFPANGRNQSIRGWRGRNQLLLIEVGRMTTNKTFKQDHRKGEDVRGASQRTLGSTLLWREVPHCPKSKTRCGNCCVVEMACSSEVNQDRSAIEAVNNGDLKVGDLIWKNTSHGKQLWKIVAIEDGTCFVEVPTIWDEVFADVLGW